MVPKAENRKKPPSQLGQVPGRGNQGKLDHLTLNAQRESVKDKKQEILDKMKKIQTRNNK